MKPSNTLEKLPALLLALLLAGSPAFAADNVGELDKQIEAIDKRAPERKPSREAMEEISRDTGVPQPQLEKQHVETKLSTGSLYIANTLAKETGKSFDEIVALHKQGNGWGKIAKDNNVKLGPIVSKTKKLAKKQRKGQGKDKESRKVSGEKKRDREGKADREERDSRDEHEKQDPKPQKKQKGKKK